MCRLFGFRSVLQSQVHDSLAHADNALAVQSVRHPDGWGVAYYVSGAPHMIKSAGRAEGDRLFSRVSGIVTSQTVMAHIRQATQGELSTLNSHPFQYGRWVMAHNGDVPGFSELREELVSRIAPVFRRFLLGDTDSEVIFHLFLSKLAMRTDLHRKGTQVSDVAGALEETVAEVRELADVDAARRALLTIMITDGELLLAYHGGKELHWSTWKGRCAERGHCPHFTPECEAPTRSGFVNHLLISSEPLQGENRWQPMREGEIVAVDHSLRLYHPALA